MADEIIQVQLTNQGSQQKIIVGDGTTIKAGTIFPILVRRSAVQPFIDEGLVEQVPATSAIPINSTFADIEVAGSQRVSIPFGPKKQNEVFYNQKVEVNSTEYNITSRSAELGYYPVTLVVSGTPTTFSLDYARFSSSTDRYEDTLSLATIRTATNPTPLSLDHLDNYKDEIVLRPGQILNCRINPRIAELEQKGLIQLTNISVTPTNVPTPQTTVGPSPQGLPFPSISPSPLFMYVDFFGILNSAPTFPIS